MKKIISAVLLFIMMFGLMSCDTSIFKNPGDFLGGGEVVEETPKEEDLTDLITEYDVSDSAIDLDTSYAQDDIFISLSDEKTTISKLTDGVTIEDKIIHIVKEGTYVLEGTLTDGQIIVSVDGNVHLVFNGINITSKVSAPIVITGKKKKVITLVENTTNTLTDASTYTSFVDDENSEPNGALFSKKALTINGEGKLIVNGNYNNGISVKDELKILSGIIIINSLNHAVKGNDAVIIKGGNLNLTAGSDGIQSDKESETTGVVYITNAILTIDAVKDGIQAYSLLYVDSGEIKITIFAGSQTKLTTEESAKGLKSDLNIKIIGGVFIIDSYDDAIHADNSIIIDGGTFTLSTADDAIHAENTLEINGGNINILRSYEGLEAARIVINNGIINIKSSDDGINAASDEVVTGRYNPNLYIIINGGIITVDASGDGIDSNGTILVNGGEVYVNGPTSSGDASLDADGGILVNGGLVIAVGSLGMVETPASNSKVNTLSVAFSSNQAANQKIEIKNNDGDIIAEFLPTKTYRSLIISSEDLLRNQTYTLWINGSKVETFTVQSTITSIGKQTPNRPR